ncbi:MULTISPECIES: GTPase Era [Candidatus Ichthyocystis]|uniref:GTPase Era n=1 Tax=Candidatus Ichthyocystis hellenicum TaxID=1561003 RepID=A0A0S4M425_9BURK|nr:MULTISPECIES: GTPase Era [Ichthyocystis]CUT17602.1 GTPase Era [Candidatus Ichthyocystis hellenicum]
MLRCGQVGLVGRPNVGKSTLLNCLIGAKISITSRKPQTTRHRLLGVLTRSDCQYLFVDTPGSCKSGLKRLSVAMASALKATIADVDVVVLVVDATNWTDLDESFLRQLGSSTPVVVAVNKMDVLKEKHHDTSLRDLETKISSVISPVSFCLVSARKNKGTDVLLSTIASLLPQQSFFYPEDMLTDRTDRFLVSEIIREKVFRCLGDELPYGSAVRIESFEESPSITKIRAVIYVEKENYKRIIIGKNGDLIKMIGTVARHDIEKFLGCKVFLGLWVKVKLGWCNDAVCLKELGYEITESDEQCPKKLS